MYRASSILHIASFILHITNLSAPDYHEFEKIKYTASLRLNATPWASSGAMTGPTRLLPGTTGGATTATAVSVVVQGPDHRTGACTCVVEPSAMQAFLEHDGTASKSQPHSSSVTGECRAHDKESGQECDCTEYQDDPEQPGYCSECYHDQKYHLLAAPAQAPAPSSGVKAILAKLASGSTSKGKLSLKAPFSTSHKPAFSTLSAANRESNVGMRPTPKDTGTSNSAKGKRKKIAPTASKLCPLLFFPLGQNGILNTTPRMASLLDVLQRWLKEDLKFSTSHIQLAKMWIPQRKFVDWIPQLSRVHCNILKEWAKQSGTDSTRFSKPEADDEKADADSDSDSASLEEGLAMCIDRALDKAVWLHVAMYGYTTWTWYVYLSN
ncbi:hypothetical protein B0H13DRAFT_1909562 [Mycena leptocephala]|nr:hypothetical protein B0H13DRAFT_1909562 [Mycena leptocephala]